MSESEDWEEEDMQAIVIDNGSATIKAGFSGDEKPISIFPSIVGRDKNINKMLLTYEDDNISVGIEAGRQKDILNITYPIQHGIVTSWDDMEKIWHHVFYNSLKAMPEEHAVLTTQAPLTPKANREKTMQIMFETFNVPAHYNAVSSVLALHASGRTTGIVLDSGYGFTDTVPIYEGYPLPHAIIRNDISTGHGITTNLMQLLNNEYSHEFVRDIKENLCFIAPVSEYKDYRVSYYELPDGKTISIGSEKFECTEKMFCGDNNIAKMLFDSIMKCDIDIRKDLYDNIVLSGGNTLFKGMTVRLRNELRLFRKTSIIVDGYTRKYLKSNECKFVSQDVMDIIYCNYDEFKIVSPVERNISVWLGGSMLVSLSTFQEMWICKDEYDESGPGIIRRRIF